MSTRDPPPSVRAATLHDVPGLPSRSPCHTGCCGLLLHLLPVRAFIEFLQSKPQSWWLWTVF